MLDLPDKHIDPDWCYLYLRKSRDEEHDPHVLDRHRALLLRVFAADGIVVPPENIFAEIGSGELIESRPVFQRLLRAWDQLPLRRGGRVGVAELSRLSRGSPTQQGRVQDSLIRAGLYVRTPGRFYNLNLFEDRFAFQAAGLVSNAELELFKQRVQVGWEAMLLKGLIRNGQAPWGYRWSKDEGNLLAHPARFPTLQLCCRLALTQSVKSLARENGVPERNLLSALRNPTICGWPALRHGPTGSLDSQGRREYHLLPRIEWRWPGEQSFRYPHACTYEQWEELQVILDSRYSRRAKLTGTEGWCRDVVRFAAHPVPARCGSYAAPGRYQLLYEVLPPGAPKLYINRGEVHAAAAEALSDLFGNAGLLEQAIEAYRRSRADREHELLTVTELIAERERQERHILQLLERELDAHGDQLRRIVLLRSQKEEEARQLAARIEALQRHATPADSALALVQQVSQSEQGFAEWWPEMTESDRRLLARACFEAIEVTVTRDWPAYRREVTGIRWRDWLEPYRKRKE